MTATPDIWIIGDVQGCCTPLEALLAHPLVAQSPNARLWFAGDLVNRGPASLATLRRIMALGERAVSVLGNHDLHLLAVAAGVGKVKKGDTISEILDAPDAQDIIDWVRHLPLAHYEHRHLLVHAGVYHSWSAQKTLALAGEAQQALRADSWKSALARMYGNKPNYWDDGLRGDDRLRAIINVTTRMRMCLPDGRLDFTHKGGPAEESESPLTPWFDLPGRAASDDTIVFGHWSTLGLLLRPNAVCLDTGCVWGRQLTAMRLRDRAIAQVPCAQSSKPHTH